VCVSFPGEATIEMVNERGKKKAWAFDHVSKTAVLLMRLSQGRHCVGATSETRRVCTCDWVSASLSEHWMPSS